MDTMSMVSYYNHPAAASAMYRSQYHLNQAHHHPQSAGPPPPSHHQYHPHHPNSMSWYPFNGGQMTGTPTYSNCMEEQPNPWNSSHSHPGAPPPPPNQMFADGVVDYQHHHHNNLHHHQQLMQQHQHQSGHMEAQHHSHHENQLPSPPITVSGSELSSPGAASGNVSPPNNNNNPLVLGVHQTRPPPVRSPYEWIKKTNYTTQPNPETDPFHHDYNTPENGKGRTRTSEKYRTVYTDHQRHELEKEFTFINKYITIRRKQELATRLSLSDRQIKIWFQNRRAKDRKLYKKTDSKQPLRLIKIEDKKDKDDRDIDNEDEENSPLPSCRLHENYHGRRACSTPIREAYEYDMLKMRQHLYQEDMREKKYLPRLVNVPPPLPSPPLIVADYNRQICNNLTRKTRTKDKYRVVYTDHQRVELEKEFYYSRYITIRRKAELASNLGLSERQVKIWFQNRRAKERKQVKKREEFTCHGKDASTSSGIPLHPVQQHQSVLIHHHHHSAGGQSQLHPGSSGGSVSAGGSQLSPVNAEQSSLNM